MDEKTIDILSTSGQVITSTLINAGAKGYFSIMQHDYIILPFVLSEPKDFGLGSYVDLRGVFNDAMGGKLAKTYYITNLQNPTYNTATEGYEYKLRLDAYYWLWKNKIFKYTPENAGQEASWSLTATLDVHLGVFIRNLAALGYTYNGHEFEFSIDSMVENKAIALTYNNTKLINALNMMAEALNCEWWVMENVIHFGRLENGDAVELEIGISAETMTRNDSKGTYATRIYAFGSTRNIPTNYRPTTEQVMVNGVVQKRLMLPEDTPYIDAYPNMDRDQIVESIVVFDDVYPRRVGTLSDVQTVDRAVTGEDGEQVDTFKAYQYKDTGLAFDASYILPDQELRIVFQSGKLNGLDFGVTFNPNNADPIEQLWEIVANEDYGRLLPDETIKPENGDTYILYGFDIKLVSDQYVPAAEQELKQEAEKYVAKTKIDDGTYTVPLYSTWVEEDEINRTFDVGQRIKLVNYAFFGAEGRTSRIIGWEMDLDIPYNNPIYTIGESAQYSRLNEIENKINSITYRDQIYQNIRWSGFYIIRTKDSTPASDSSVYSSLKSLSLFLRKDRDDVAKGLITHKAGAVFGPGFVDGLTGHGSQIDGNGNGTFRRLKAWELLEVPEIRFNRVEVYTGVGWRTFGGGVIESAVPDTDEDGVTLQSGVITLHLEDGEYGTVAVDDLCQGIFHNTDGGNEVETEDQRNGNFRFAGFSTVYFRITEILDKERNSKFRYVLRGVSDRWDRLNHPMDSMSFACYANPTDPDRQSCRYETTEYAIGLKDMTTWEYGESNIYRISGLLEGFTLGGTSFEGYGDVIGNGYFYGNIVQFDNAPYRMELDTEGDGMLGAGDRLKVTCRVMKGWEDVTDRMAVWGVTRESGDQEDDDRWNSGHGDFAGSITLTEDDLGNGSSTLFRFTAQDTAGLMITAGL